MSDPRVDLYCTQALWYAWGRLDSGEYRGQDIRLEAFDFMVMAKDVADDFYARKTHHLESIQGLWAKFVAKKSWREATEEERLHYLAGYKERLPLVYRETEHGLEVREK